MIVHPILMLNNQVLPHHMSHPARGTLCLHKLCHVLCTYIFFYNLVSQAEQGNCYMLTSGASEHVEEQSPYFTAAKKPRS